MIRIVPTIGSVFLSIQTMAQFPPAAGQPGTTALHADSSAFIGWAVGCEVQRGPQDISSIGLGPASTGDASMAIGPATMNDVVSLGDGGIAILTFSRPITNGPGWDFAVFENSFSDTYLEFAFVEVSSNGTDYFQFPATSNTPVETQVAAFGDVAPTHIDNLAGKYRGGFGTPFDLEQMDGIQGLDILAITHVKLIDVVGSIQPAFATYDHLGQAVNDPWSTPFASSGFDLDAVGVINQQTTGIGETRVPALHVSAYPNPMRSHGRLQFDLARAQQVTISLLDPLGRPLHVLGSGYRSTGPHMVPLDLSTCSSGTYLIVLATTEGTVTTRIHVDHDRP